MVTEKTLSSTWPNKKEKSKAANSSDLGANGTRYLLSIQHWKNLYLDTAGSQWNNVEKLHLAKLSELQGDIKFPVCTAASSSSCYRY